MAVNAKISTNPKNDIDTKININKKIGIDKPIFDFPHTLGKISIDIMPTRIKVHDMKISKWNLIEEVQICPLNLGAHNEPQVVKLNADLDSFVTDVID